ncbi:MAG: DUF3131 domain-containing protein [Elusimicrobia bacterium]|nr:DUF3131 domain-containing protein [Elusimicrobiota bacterium]
MTVNARIFKLAAIYLGLITLSSSVNGGQTISHSDRMFLKKIFSDTWNYIEHFVDDKTGLPYDSSHRSNLNTSITNIGFYIASSVVAAQTGLISHGKSLAQVKQALDSLTNVEKWNGFPVSWINVHTLETTDQQFSTVDHLGNFCAGLILAKNIFPEVKNHVDALLASMNWSVIYEPENHYYKGGYNLSKKTFAIQQSWGKWYYNFLGADTRMSSFLGIAQGDVPMLHWEALDRNVETRYGQGYYVPGWQGGGLFMQFLSGLFLDERQTVLGKSAANFAYAQISHAQRIGAPVWGWSAASAPTGEYLGWGAIKDDIVTPHASVLAISYYPSKVVANLKRLERGGARSPFIDNGQHEFGFRDSYNWKSAQVSQGYLMLDQTMIFLSLANFLDDGVVWRNFEKDPVVQQGLHHIREYSHKDAGVFTIYQKRDQEVPNEQLTIPLTVE